MDETLLQRYISQQSAVWKALLDKRESLTAPFAVLEPKPDRVILIGSGSSHYAALMARPVLEQAFGVEVSCFVPSQEEQLIRCRAAHPLYIAVSQSGISTNTYTLIRSLRAQGYPVVALTEHLDSPVGKAASLAIPLLIGEERIGAKTKGVTATVLTLMLLGLSVCRDESYRTRLYRAGCADYPIGGKSSPRTDMEPRTFGGSNSLPPPVRHRRKRWSGGCSGSRSKAA